MNFDIPYLIISVLCFVPAIVFHEVMHGFAAYKLGDPTAKRAGRLSLNPAKHVDPFGTILMPFLLMAMGGPVFGYAKPVPYNPAYFKNPKRDDLIVGLAGPFGNLILAILGAGLAWAIYLVVGNGVVVTELVQYLYLFAYMFVMVNLYLMFFNLIPLPPLDGSSIIGFLLPKKYMPQYYQVQAYAMPIFMIVVILVPYVFHVNPIGIYLDWTAGALGNLLLP